MEFTKKDFLKNCNNSKLAAKVLKQIGLPFKELIEYPQNYRDAGAGVPGFIYYTDTVKFAKKNLVLIMNALVYFEDETGCPLNKPTDNKTAYYNWLAWFALESTIQDLIYYKEQ